MSEQNLDLNQVEPKQPEHTIEREGNIATITKPEGSYSIAYGFHLVEGKPKIPEGIDGICFEMAYAHPITSAEIQRVIDAAGSNQKPIIANAKSKGLPLLATDCAITPFALAEEVVGPLEFILSGYLFDKIREEIAKKGGMTRREFFKSMLVGGASLYLALPTVSMLGRAGSSLTGIGEGQTAELAKAAQKAHPEYKIFIYGLRNVVVAQKMQFILELGTYKHLLATIGAGHVGLENAILSSEEERIAFLIRMKPILPQVVTDPKTLYQITEYRASQDGWEVSKQYEEPKLKQLIS